MTETQDRRNPKVPRVELATLVDICAPDANLPPFQGKSGNISGRGMQVRTSHLPEIGAPLVCRFEHEQREVLVEGRVAWRSEGQDGGEFGVQFTAVDADSAEILRSLRPMSSVSSAFQAKGTRPEREPDLDEDDELLLKSGDRVRLHIDGLASPMKACVHEASERRVRLGSNLEFLKMGREVEIENVDGGERRGAKVDSVNVVLNPSTSVPELVVMLRYETDLGSPAPGFTQDLDDNSDAESDEDFDEPRVLGEATLALRARVADVVGRATEALSWARRGAEKMSQETRRTVSAARERMAPSTNGTKSSGTQSSGAKPSAPKPLRAQSGRRSAPVTRPSNITRAGIASKRPGSVASSVRPGSRPAPEVPRRASKKGLGFALGATSLLGLLVFSSLALKKNTESPAAKPDATAPAPTLPTPGAAAPLPATTAPAAVPPTAVAMAAPVGRQSPEGIVAEVPLFGARPITTSEAVAKSNESEAALERRAAAASVPDEQFKAPEATTPEKESLTTWGRGQLNLPTVHRIRLDAAGAEIVGVAEPAGFAVVIPGRKAMETGRAIEKRDRRILKIKTSNTAEGARINFEFRGPVPPYRVRLKNDFVEFFVSAPDGVRAEL